MACTKTPKWDVKAKLRDDRTDAAGANDVGALDFVRDQLATSRKLRVLTVIDTFSHYVSILDVKFSFRGEDMAQSLDRVCSKVGYPKTTRAGNGPVFISRSLGLRVYHRSVIPGFIRRGKSTDTPLNGKFCQECLNAHWSFVMLLMRPGCTHSRLS